MAFLWQNSPCKPSVFLATARNSRPATEKIISTLRHFTAPINSDKLSEWCILFVIDFLNFEASEKISNSMWELNCHWGDFDSDLHERHDWGHRSCRLEFSSQSEFHTCYILLLCSFLRHISQKIWWSMKISNGKEKSTLFQQSQGL